MGREGGTTRGSERPASRTFYSWFPPLSILVSASLTHFYCKIITRYCKVFLNLFWFLPPFDAASCLLFSCLLSPGLPHNCAFNIVVQFYDFFCRPHDSAEQKISMHCSENGLVNTLQMLTTLYPESVSNTEVFLLGQVKSKMRSFYFSQHYLTNFMLKNP